MNCPLKIPDDLSVVGIDNIDLAEFLDPPLTTVDIFPEQSGRMAAQLLVKIINGELGETMTVQGIDPKLIERGSVRSLQ